MPMALAPQKARILFLSLAAVAALALVVALVAVVGAFDAAPGLLYGALGVLLVVVVAEVVLLLLQRPASG